MAIDKKTGEFIAVPDCFGVITTHNIKSSKCDEKYLPQYDLKLNKDKGVFEVQAVDPVDIDEIIQSNKDNCGLNLALLNISRGVPQEKYCDDGKHGGDYSGTTNINVAYQEMLNNKAVAEKLAKELGIDNYEDFTDTESVMNFLKAKVEAQALLAKGAGQPGSSEGGDK